MDVNGTRSWTLHRALHWPSDASALRAARVVWSAGRGASPGLRLRSGLPDGVFEAVERSRAPRLAACDAFGAFVWWDGSTLQSIGAAVRDADGRLQTPPPETVPLPTGLTNIDTLAFDDQGLLAMAFAEQLWLVDRRERALPVVLPTPGWRPVALAARPGGGFWGIDATGRLRRTAGRLRLRQGVALPHEDHALLFQPLDAEPDPMRLLDLPAALPEGEQARALAVRADGLLALAVARTGAALSDAAPAAVRLLADDASAWSPAFDLGAGVHPFSIAWGGDHALLVLAHGRLHADGTAVTHEAGTVLLRFEIDPADERAVRDGIDELAPLLWPAGDYYPLDGVAGVHDGSPLVVPPVRAGGGVARERWLANPFARGGALPQHTVFHVRLPRVAAGAPTPQLHALLAVPRPERLRQGWRGNALPAWAGAATDAGLAPSIVDSGQGDTVWHRLHVEAHVPRGCAIVVWLAASEFATPSMPASDAHFFGSAEAGGAPAAGGAWWPHLVGDRGALPPALAAWPGLPQAAWQPGDSGATGRLFGRSRLACDPIDGEAGGFDVLVQRAGVAVRALQGRRLWLAAEFFGDGRATPVLASLRAEGARFSYRDRYLPGLYGEALTGAAADAVGPATGADFLERLLAGFEGPMTAIEGAAADSWRATDAAACPDEALPWLGAWVGLAFEPGLAPMRRRRMLRAASDLWALHGTLRGLEYALELATSDVLGHDERGRALEAGAVSGGEIVVVENWRLRRTLATILGAELVDRDDPLVAGVVRNPNSVVGDALVLGDPLKTDFLALFRRITDAPLAQALRPDLRADQDPRHGDLATLQRDARRHLFDNLAFRVTVLVHEQLAPLDMGLVRRVAEAAAPAHVRVDVVASRHPFLLAVASLVGVDTYLGPGEPGAAVELGRSRLGWIDRLSNAASLDSRLEDFDIAPGRPPVADLGPDFAQPPDRPIALSALRSRADAGRYLTTYRWTLRQRP